MPADSVTGPAFEALESRSMMSTVAYGDFNGDGRDDVAAITSPTTVTVSLARPDGTYAVSATLTSQKGKTLSSVAVSDLNRDGKPDVYAITPYEGGWFTQTWLGNGDGTFAAGKMEKTRWPPHVGHGGTW